MARSLPIEAEIDPKQWAQVLRDVKKLAPEIRKQLIKEHKELLEPISSAAKRNAGWSSRIPGAITKTVTARKVGLRVRSAKAPHARPYEGITGGQFRHPVFGNRDNWVPQSARPFLKPAMEANRDEFIEKSKEAVNKAARECGWK